MVFITRLLTSKLGRQSIGLSLWCHIGGESIKVGEQKKDNEADFLSNRSCLFWRKKTL